MTTDADTRATAEPPKYFQEAASGVPIAVIAFGFAVIALSLANAEIINLGAGLFVPVALTTGALGMLVGGLWEFRNGNLFGATFGVAYALFLFTTGAILRWFAPEITALDAVGASGFGDAFGAWLIMWAIITVLFSYGAYFVNLPAFLAFTLLWIVYLLAAIVNIAEPSSTTLLHIAGWVGIADGIAAWWVGMGLVLNEMGPRPIIPMIPYPYGNNR
ncbi:MAG: acetate uptake transporter [Solirubrobacteraceae bacterium]